MIIDTLVVQAVVQELQELVGGRIQHVVQPTAESVGLEVYANGKRHHLLLSAQHTSARLHLVSRRQTRGTGPDTPLMLLLRKYVRGGRITAIECPPLERIVTLSITKFPPSRNQGEPEDEADDEPVDEPFYAELVLEILGRSSNIILLRDDGVILEAVRYFERGRSERPIRPRLLYEAPSAQDKADPRSATAEGMLSLEGPSLARALVSAYRGISPQLGKELAFRLTGDADAPVAALADAEAAAELLRTLITNAAPQPCLATDEEGMPLAVAPYWLEHYEHVRGYDTMSEALADAFAAIDQQSGHGKQREALAARVAEWAKRAETKVSQLQQQLSRADALEQLRWEGEMIYAYAHAVKPGQSELLLDSAVIVLDPTLSPSENAQRRFREYDKAKAAVAGIPTLLEEAKAQARYGREMIDMVRLAESFDEIQALERELSEQGVIREASSGKRKAGKQPPKSGPLRIVTADGWTIHVGRSAAQNEEVTFKLGQSHDLWLHARDYTGGHVIIKGPGSEVPEATLARAAELAAYYSGARTAPAVEVDIARRSQVRRIKGGPPGLVHYQAERTIRVAPRGLQPEERR